MSTAEERAKRRRDGQIIWLLINVAVLIALLFAPILVVVNSHVDASLVFMGAAEGIALVYFMHEIWAIFLKIMEEHDDYVIKRGERIRSETS